VGSISKIAIVLLLAVLQTGWASAQSFPTRPIRVVVPFAAGAALDSVARLVATHMGPVLKQPVIVENRPGADGNIGAGLVAKAAPDGYTLLLTPSNLAASPALYRNLTFDAGKDFTPISQLVSYGLLLVASSKVPASSVSELVALARSKPGALNYGHSGVGSQPHLAMELLKLSTAIDIAPIPYKGSAPIQAALISGEIDVAFITIPSGVQPIKAGRFRALGVSSVQKSAALPNVPTIAESGVTDFEVDSWSGLFAPAKTPADIIDALHRATKNALDLPDVRARLESLGNDVIASTPEAFTTKYRADLAKYPRIIREARIPPQD
jgi:tripartite-type tricarboxylate transporter receptor subunit TctC